MKDSKSLIGILITGIFAILCVLILSATFLSAKKDTKSSGISATGSASCNFDSDLIVWRGSFSAYGFTPKDAYSTIKEDAKLIKDYLKKNNVADDELVFSSVTISQHYDTVEDPQSGQQKDIANGYDLSQQVTVTSKDVDKVEKISRDITDLIESGVAFSSDAPEYYYTQLDSLKLKLIKEATENAKQRVDIMAKSSSSTPTALLNASLGVFQITATNTASSEYSYDGAFDTSSKQKTASITVRLSYDVK